MFPLSPTLRFGGCAQNAETSGPQPLVIEQKRAMDVPLAQKTRAQFLKLNFTQR